MLKSLICAFLMYSRIPMPHVEWKEENRRYALGFFPLVGAVQGMLLVLWYLLADKLLLPPLLFAAGAVLLPVLVTGGIHLDGFCDVTDARSAYAEKARRLEILSDPHIGSFAVLHLCLYLIAQTALMTGIHSLRMAALTGCSFVISRALSGLSAVTFPAAKKDGTLQSFVRPAHRRVTVGMEAAFLLLAGTGMLLLSPAAGIAALAAAGLVFLYYRHTARRDFGGVTGDLCGWFLQLCEIGCLAAAVLVQHVTEVLS